MSPTPRRQGATVHNIVVNSTPLIASAKVGKLGLLRDLYNKDNIPEAVWAEVTAKNYEVSKELGSSGEWLRGIPAIPRRTC